MRPTRHGHSAMKALLLPAAVIAMAMVVWLIGCTNEPFDPETIENNPPVARIFVGSADDLNATSYFRRTFSWSGSDTDGFVEEFYVSIETTPGVEIWTATMDMDTTMTFVTDDEGLAYANLSVVCRDNRGAFSDTVRQYIPLRNFPPEINPQRDFDPEEWTYSSAIFRLSARDLDGQETMDDVFRYKLDTADDGVVFDCDDADANAALGWIECPFPDPNGTEFQIELRFMPPGPARTLTVTVGDEANADAVYEYTWEVRAPLGSVLLVMDAAPTTDAVYIEYMDETFGEGQWSRFEISEGLPEDDSLWLLRDTFREFDVVMWYTGGTASSSLVASIVPLNEYLFPDPVTEPDMSAGKLLLISKNVSGAAYVGGLAPWFVTNVLGVSYTPDPLLEFGVDSGKQALGLDTWLPPITSTTEWAKTIGVTALAGTGQLYRLEYCRCYAPRPSFEPYIGVRVPERTPETPYATTVTISTQLERYNRSEVKAMLTALLEHELGVELP